MSREITQKTRDICAKYQAAIARGEKERDVIGYLAAAYDVQRPAIWRNLISGGLKAPYAPRQSGGKGRPHGGGTPGWSARRREAAIAHRQAQQPTSAPVHRDPCPRCGVRGDVDCGHNKQRIGVSFA